MHINGGHAFYSDRHVVFWMSTHCAIYHQVTPEQRQSPTNLVDGISTRGRCLEFDRSPTYPECRQMSRIWPLTVELL